MVNEDKMKALDAAISNIEKQFGKGSVMKLGESTANLNVECIPTGSLSLDIALGIGGVPKGRVVEIYGPESSGKTTVALHMVAEHFDVTVDDLCGNKRNSKIVTPRQIAMYLCREIISTPLKSIGKCLGNRDHTTIMHGIDKIEKEINNDENLKNTIETLKKKINPQG